MLAIFVFSAQPSKNLPHFNTLDYLIKKGAHMLGYGLLAASYWRALGWGDRRRPLAWLLAVLYAATDEFHQSFVAGRNASVLDVLVFDNLGALAGLWLVQITRSRKPRRNALL